jgi:hypothetical protein
VRKNSEATVLKLFRVNPELAAEPALLVSQIRLALSEGRSLTSLEKLRNDEDVALPSTVAVRDAVSPPQSLTIRFQTQPPEAEIVVDGVVQGRTPATLEVLQGARLVLRKAGFVSTAPVVARSNEPIEATLSRGAMMTVRSSPAGASVQLDGVDVGRTPCSLDTVAPGPHVVTLAANSFQPASRKVEANLDTPLELDVTLAAFARLQVVSRPAGAAVTVNGVAMGETPNTLTVDAGKKLYVMLTARLRLPQLETVRMLVPGEQEAITVELGGASDAALARCITQSDRKASTLKTERSRAAQVLAKLQKAKKDVAKAEVKVRELETELAAQLGLRDACRAQKR